MKDNSLYCAVLSFCVETEKTLGLKQHEAENVSYKVKLGATQTDPINMTVFFTLSTQHREGAITI